MLKEDYGFDRLSRRGETGVKIEVYSASIGYNIKKYHKAKMKQEELKREKTQTVINRQKNEEN